jgi:hypothetical protein
MHTTARPGAFADRLGAAAAALATEACVELREEVGLQHDSKLNRNLTEISLRQCANGC